MSQNITIGCTFSSLTKSQIARVQHKNPQKRKTYSLLAPCIPAIWWHHQKWRLSNLRQTATNAPPSRLNWIAVWSGMEAEIGTTLSSAKMACDYQIWYKLPSMHRLLECIGLQVHRAWKLRLVLPYPQPRWHAAFLAQSRLKDYRQTDRREAA